MKSIMKERRPRWPQLRKCRKHFKNLQARTTHVPRTVFVVFEFTVVDEVRSSQEILCTQEDEVRALRAEQAESKAAAMTAVASNEKARTTI